MTLTIEAEWENLERGTPEERACFAALGIFDGKNVLTQAEDTLVGVVRERVHLSGYRLAEWIAWNWWRLRWEPRGRTMDWALAHHMSTIGGGYLWPNITIFSDGERTVFLTKATEKRAEEPLRYMASSPLIVPVRFFEAAVDDFINRVQERLRTKEIASTNLDKIWEATNIERKNASLALRRRFEALLGYDPDDADVGTIDKLLQDASRVGTNAMTEVAAEHLPGREVLGVGEFESMAAAHGFDATPSDVVRLESHIRLPPVGDVPAWKRGEEAAKVLRNQENITGFVSNDKLTALAGVASKAIVGDRAHSSMSFALDENNAKGRVVLRSRWPAGRRFDLARLLGDRIAVKKGDQLLPATRSYTYRQKLQRAFAAELLSPFDLVIDMLDGDFSEEKQREVAEYFEVSEITVRTVLVNHDVIGREELEFDVERVSMAA